MNLTREQQQRMVAVMTALAPVVKAVRELWDALLAQFRRMMETLAPVVKQLQAAAERWQRHARPVWVRPLEARR